MTRCNVKNFCALWGRYSVSTAKDLESLRCASENVAHMPLSFVHHCTFQAHPMQSAGESSCGAEHWCGEKDIHIASVMCQTWA